MISIFTLTSSLHDETAVSRVTKEFLDSLDIEYAYEGNNFARYGMSDLDLIYVRTGGSEAYFLEALPEIEKAKGKPIYLLTNGKSNSLAASMEILSYLNQHNISGEILHGDTAYITRRILALEKRNKAAAVLSKMRLGVIGKPSDWLISSLADAQAVKQRLGIKIVEIPIDEVQKAFDDCPAVRVPDVLMAKANTPHLTKATTDAHRLYLAMRKVADDHQLDGFTIRCFDLLTAVHNTGCWALAMIKSEGRVAGYEGDVPEMLSMAVARALTGTSCFQANPSQIDPDQGIITFAHCTIPLDLAGDYELDTHFESGIGIAIRGYMPEGPVTILKVSGNLDRHFVAEGTLLRSEAKPDLCRTQQVIRLDNPDDARYFLTRPIGNHHIVVPGRHALEIEALLAD